MPYIGNTTSDFSIDTGNITNRAVTATKLSPSSVGSNGQVLSVDGSGNLQWGNDSNAPEGTSVLSTGVAGVTKYLRVDGDGTCSWQTIDYINVTAQNSVAATVYPLFAGNGATATGPLSPGTDTGFTYNSFSGNLTATEFTGALTGNVTGNCSGTALSVTQAAQSAITSLGTLTGLTVSGDVLFDNGTNSGKDILFDASANKLEFSDDVIASFGNSGDLQINHVNAESANYITSKNNVLYICGKTAQTAIQIVPDAATDLRYAGVQKLITTSLGARVVGDLQMGNTAGVRFHHAGTTSIFETQTAADDLLFKTTPSGGSTTERLRIESDGNVGIGTTSPAQKLDVSGNIKSTGKIYPGGNIHMPDSVGIKLGASDDFVIYHYATDGHNYIESANGQSIIFQNWNGSAYESLAKFIPDSSCQLFFNGSEKIRTTTGGVQVYGQTASNNGFYLNNSSNIVLEDNGEAQFGNSGDLTIFHDGGDSYIRQGGVGALSLESSSYVDVRHTSAGTDPILRMVNEANTTAGALNVIRSLHDGRNCAEIRLGRNNDANDFSASAASTQGDIQFWTTQSGSLSRKGTFINSGGLCFGTDTAAANALDDYEEGSFTPKLGGTTNSSTYNVEGTGTYVKIGRKVTITLRFNNLDLDNNAAGAAKIFNMPFTAGHCPASGNSGQTNDAQYYNVTLSGDDRSWYIGNNTTAWIGLVSRNNNTWDSWYIDDFESSTFYMNWSGTYFADA